MDLNAISGKKYQAIGPEGTPPYFKKDHTHSSKKGARLNAASIAEGLRGTSCPLKEALLPVGYSYTMDANVPAYNEFDGYGYDFGTAPTKDGKPYFFSVRVPDGNYKVTVRLGDKKRKAQTTVRAESRRLMLDDVATAKGKFEDRTFIVHKRQKGINLKDSVRINQREVGTPTWDDKLTLEFTGHAPAVQSVTITPVTDADSVTTVYLCGNSTVVDQTKEPWASWGQIMPAYFDSSVCVANNDESGQSASSFLDSKRYDKVLSMARPGDWVLIEFGHNDQKERGPGKGAYYNFATCLKIFIDRARAAGLNPVFITPTARRHFDDNGKIKDTHGDYPQAMREVAAREGVPVIELNPMTKTLYETMGTEDSKKAFVHYPANTYPGQTEPLADNTHFNPFGATQVAKCVREGLKKAAPELAKHLKDAPAYDPAHPDDPAAFYWPEAPFFEAEKPYGN